MLKINTDGLETLEALVAHFTHVVPLTCVHLHVPLEVVQSGPLVVTLVTLVAARSPVLQDTMHIQTPLLTEGLATCRTLVLWVPGGSPRVDLLLVHTDLQQTAKLFITFYIPFLNLGFFHSFFIQLLSLISSYFLYSWLFSVLYVSFPLRHYLF